MAKKDRDLYPHEELMKELHLTIADLPPNTQAAIREFDRLDAQEDDYEPALEPAAKVLKAAIREWYDHHEPDELHYPLDLNERACHIAFYVQNMTIISPEDFRKLGGKAKLNPNGKTEYSVGKFSLKPHGDKKHFLLANEEEANDQDDEEEEEDED